MHLLIYTTAGCHLCEQAKEIIWPLLDDYPFHLKEVDIADSDDLIARYGVRIPVLKFSDSIMTLDWPFDESQLRHFFTRCLPQTDLL